MAYKCTGRRMASGHSHEHISHLQTELVSTGEKAIRPIGVLIRFVEENGNKSLYCLDPFGSPAYIRVVNGATKYLQTYADGIPTNNLLSLPLV